MKNSAANIRFLTPDPAFQKEVSDFLADWFSPEETVKVQTSGSTGAPKILAVSKDRMRASARMTCRYLNLKREDTALLCLPVAYISGKMMLVRALEAGLQLSAVPPSTKPLELLDLPVTFAALTPLQAEISLGKLHLIRKVILGGAAVSTALKHKIKAALDTAAAPTEVFETYGMSETLSHIALKKIYPEAELDFHLLPGVTISLDAAGCLIISAPQISAEPVHTRDLAEITGPATFRFLGRADHLINSGGLKIVPETIEEIIKKEIIKDVVVLGVPDPVLGQRLIAIVEGIENSNLREKINSLDYPTKNHRPKEIRFEREFPRLPNGKLDRRRLQSKHDH